MLRGLAFLYRFARTFSRLIRAEDVREALGHVAEALDPSTGCFRVGRRSWPKAKNLGQDADGQWSFGFPPSSFPLLELVGNPGDPCPWLTPDLQAIREGLPGVGVAEGR